jgi:hypothetical protein
VLIRSTGLAVVGSRSAASRYHYSRAPHLRTAMIIIGTPHTKGAGYYKNDDTASGGKKIRSRYQRPALTAKR